MYSLLVFVTAVTSCVICFVSIVGRRLADPIEFGSQLRSELRGNQSQSAMQRLGVETKA